MPKDIKRSLLDSTAVIVGDPLDNPTDNKLLPIGLGPPRVVVHQCQDDPSKLQTILFNWPGHSAEKYGLICADIIGHAAQYYNVDPEYILEWVQKELDSPTTDITPMRSH